MKKDEREDGALEPEEPREPEGSEEPQDGATDPPADQSRRKFLRLGTMSLLTAGLVRHVAASGGGCGQLAPWGTYKDSSCTIGPNIDLDCSTGQAGGGQHKDNDCGWGSTSGDLDCAVNNTGSGGSTHEDNMCEKPGPGGDLHFDGDCGSPAENGQGVHRDDFCGNVIQLNPKVVAGDGDCGAPKGSEWTHVDQDCGKPIGGGVMAHDNWCSEAQFDNYTPPVY